MLLGLVVLATLAGGLLASCGPQATCLAVPVCNTGEQESQAACGANETACRKVEICGQTIYCRPGTADAGP